MIFSQATAADIEKYYLNTFVKFPPDSEGESVGDGLWKITAVTSKQITAVNAEGDTEVLVSLWEEQPYYMVQYSPIKSFFFSKIRNAAILLSRKPARQFKRGLCSENTYLAMLNSEGVFKSDSVRHELLEEYVNKPEFFKLDYNFAKGESSVPLSKRFAMTREKSLFVDNFCIGKIVPDASIIQAHSLFHSEIKQLVQQCNKEFEIVN